MSLKQLSIGADVEKPKMDTLGGSYTKNTGLYPATIDMAYTAKSKSGALSLNLHFKVASDKSIIRQTLWVTSGDKKGNKNYYVNQAGKKVVLPDMALADQIAQIACNKELGELDETPKTIKLWDYDAGAEKPTEVDVVLELLNKPILLGLLKVRENKTVNDGSGNYIPTREERISNKLDKVFHPSGHSVTEKVAGGEPKFHKQWADKYGEDYVEDKYDANVAAAEDDSLPETPATDTSSLFAPEAAA